jgi:hypothetical protein
VAWVGAQVDRLHQLLSTTTPTSSLQHPLFDTATSSLNLPRCPFQYSQYSSETGFN